MSILVFFFHKLKVHGKSAWNKSLSAIFKKILFILDRGEGREKERERNINVWLPFTHPLLGTWSTTQACALTGNQTSDPVLCSLVLNPLSHTSQGSQCYFFPIVFALFVYLCHILVIITMFQTFSLLLSLLWWSVTSDLWCYHCSSFGNHKLHPNKTTNLIKCFVCSDCSTNCPFPSLSFSSSLPILWDTTILKLVQLITQQCPLSVQVKGRVTHLSL